MKHTRQSLSSELRGVGGYLNGKPGLRDGEGRRRRVFRHSRLYEDNPVHFTCPLSSELGTNKTFTGKTATGGYLDGVLGLRDGYNRRRCRRVFRHTRVYEKIQDSHRPAVERIYKTGTYKTVTGPF